MTKEQFTAIMQWSRQTFGITTAEQKISHLCEEILELFVELRIKGTEDNIREEFADCFILLFGAADAHGMTYEDICKAIDDKMAINRTRKWGRPDALGVVRHVKPEFIPMRENPGFKDIVEKFDLCQPPRKFMEDKK